MLITKGISNAEMASRLPRQKSVPTKNQGKWRMTLCRKISGERDRRHRRFPKKPCFTKLFPQSPSPLSTFSSTSDVDENSHFDYTVLMMRKEKPVAGTY